MKRVIAFLGLWLLAGSPAFAICPGTPSDCPAATYSSVVVGSPSGGREGLGSLNTQTLWVNGVQITSGGGGGGGSTLTFGTHLTGGSYNGSAPITLGTDATNSNTPSTVVARDGSGNFSAGTITASLTGNATTATSATTAATATTANGLNSATSTIIVNGAAAPANGQVLTASGPTAAAWVSPGGGGNVSNTGTPTNGQLAQWTGATNIQGISAGSGVVAALQVSVGSAGAFVVLGGAGGTPSALNCTNCTNVPVGSLTGLGTGVGAALAVNVGSAGAPVLFNGAGGTPTSMVGTNINGTASGLTAGTASVANALKSASTNVSVSGATAPTNGQVLTATSSTTATWQTGGCTITANTADLVPSGCSLGTTTPLIQSATSPYIYNGTGTSGTGAQVDNVYLIELSAASAAMTLPQAGTTGFAAGVGSMVVPTGTGTTTVTPTTSTIAGLTAITLVPHQFLSFGSDGTNYEAALGMPPSGTQNLVIATPNGSTGQPTLRALVAADLPSTAVTPGSYTSTNITVDQQGRITAAANGTASASSITPGTTTISGATAPCLIENSTSTTMACPAVTAGNVTALGVSTGSAGAPVLFNGAGGTPSSMTGTNITGIPNAAVAAAPLPTPGSGATLAAPRSYYVCTTTCTVTLPTPAAGYEFCVRNDNNVSTVITFNAITSVQFENTNFTSYKTANTSIVSGGAAGDKLCVMGRDATHYLVMSFNGTWS